MAFVFQTALAAAFAALCFTGAAAEEGGRTDTYAARLAAIVGGCLDSVDGTHVPEAFRTVPLGPAYLMQGSTMSVAAPELAAWFAPGASVRDNISHFPEGTIFVWVDETGRRRRVLANSERDLAGDIDRIFAMHGTTWRRESPKVWRSVRGASARLETEEARTD